MEIKITEERGMKVARVESQGIAVSSVGDALDIMADSTCNGAYTVLIRKEMLAPEFFELRTGIAGEILQKFSTYGVRMAVTGDFSNVESKSLRDFIRESNRYGRILFVAGEEEALDRFSR